MASGKLSINSSYSWAFPGGSVVKNLPANAGETSLTPGPGSSHRPMSNKACVPQLLSPSSRAPEPQPLKPTCSSLCSTREATAVRSPLITAREQPRSPQPGKSLHSNKDPERPKIKNKLKNLINRKQTRDLNI